MNRKKLRGLALTAVILCVSSIPYISYGETNAGNDVQVSESENKTVEIKNNWLNRIIAKQLNKDVKKLTIDDLLSIKKLDLRYEKIENSIPESIGLLENLEYLDLNYSRIDGQIPKELASLSKLKYLDLGDNKISEIPKEVEDKIIKGDYTYCDVEGNKFNLTKGWHYLKGNWCYLNRYGERLTGEQTIDKKKYTFNEDGTLVVEKKDTGWEQKDSKWYYVDETGFNVKSAWKSVNGKWYYFNEQGEMLTGLHVINGKTYYLTNNGDMVSGWQTINGNWYYFSSSGEMLRGLINLNGKTYYLDDTTGVMSSSTERTINGKKYKFNASGEVINDNNSKGNGSGSWVDNYTYVQPNGVTVNTYSNYSHSNTNYNLFKYMSYPANQQSVDLTAVRLHGGITSNNCVYFLSEALRRIGVTIPVAMANTYQLENELKARGFVYSYDLSQLKPGDIVFTNNYTHVYIFMCWDKDGYAYIVDNQGTTFGSILHRRNIYNDTSITDRATHFYFYPN